MFSVIGDTVLDPFAGTAVTTLAAIAGARNSVAVEVDQDFAASVEERILGFADAANESNLRRLRRHLGFVEGKAGLRYKSETYGFPVMTRQETSLELPVVDSIRKVAEGSFEVEYSDRAARLE
jgi:hypothetical protein